MQTLTFKDLRLPESTLRAVARAGYTTPTEVQRLAIPELLAGRDVVATAQTGTGKTAAFVLPLFSRLAGADRASTGPRALILTPTRELAVQITEAAVGYGHNSGCTAFAVFGGASKNTQAAGLKKRPDVLVATPGRLLDFMQEGLVDLRQVSYLVLDEADRMLDMGFLPAVKRILQKVPTGRQTALFSATMPPAIRELAAAFLTSPVTLRAESGQVRVEKIEQSVMHIQQSDKLAVLPELIKDRGMYKVLVFTRTKHRASKVAKILAKQDLTSDSIHGDKSQSARMRALDAFRRGKIQVLVATDVASRGIDVEDVTHVVNFEIPNEAETYVHRIGRTARAGAAGVAVSLCDSTERTYLRDIEKLMGRSIAVDGEAARYAAIRAPANPAPHSRSARPAVAG